MKNSVSFLLSLVFLLGPARAQWGGVLAGSRDGGVGAVYDTSFNTGSQSPISSPWVSPVLTSSAFNQTAGNKAEAQGSNALMVLNGTGAPTFNANQYAEITLDSTDSFGPGVRFNSTTGVGYQALIAGDGRVLVLKYSGVGVSTQVLPDVTISSHAAGDRIGIGASGGSTTTFTIYVNGVAQPTTPVDSTAAITSGQPAIVGNGFQSTTHFHANDQ